MVSPLRVLRGGLSVFLGCRWSPRFPILLLAGNLVGAGSPLIRALYFLTRVSTAAFLVLLHRLRRNGANSHRHRYIRVGGPYLRHLSAGGPVPEVGDVIRQPLAGAESAGCAVSHILEPQRRKLECYVPRDSPNRCRGRPIPHPVDRCDAISQRKESGCDSELARTE